MSDKHPIRNNVIGGILLAGILSFFSLVPGGWAFVWDVLTNMVQAAIAWLRGNHPVAGWILGTLGLCAGIIVAALMMFCWVWLKRPRELDWTTYQVDEFDRLRWRWRYYGNKIIGLTSHCPSCDQQLFADTSYGYYQINFKCDNCGRDIGQFRMTNSDLVNKTTRSIERKIRTGEWVNVPER